MKKNMVLLLALVCQSLVSMDGAGRNFPPRGPMNDVQKDTQDTYQQVIRLAGPRVLAELKAEYADKHAAQEAAAAKKATCCTIQ